MMANGSEKRSINVKLKFALSILTVFLLSACASQIPNASTPPPTATSVPPTADEAPTDVPTPIERDYWPTEGWRTSTPEEQGIDSNQLAEIIDYLQEQNSFTIHSLLIIRNGYIVTDATFYPFAQDSLHDLASAAKSFTSTLIGIAIDQGYIESVEQPVLNFFPKRIVTNLDANKEAMTLEDLLTMRSGFHCTNQGSNSTDVQMWGSLDWVQFTLDLPIATEPGARYNYCNQNSHLLSAIIQEATGMSALVFAQEHLFGPLGISDVIWSSDPQGNTRGWGDLYLTPHDMAKLGFLFLNEGLWEGQQVVSPAWVNAATSGGSYGYQWWLKPSGYYFATGVGGQEIWVLSDQDMVVVMTGASGGGGAGAWGDNLIRSQIISLIVSAEQLPSNPDGVAALKSKIQDAAAPDQIQPEPVPPMPEIAHQVDGVPYVFDVNPAGLLSVTLSFPADDEALLKVTTTGSNEFWVDTQFEWLIGLDNVERIAPGRLDLLTTAKGLWESDNAFEAHLDEFVANQDKFRLRLVFDDNQVIIEQWVGGTLAGTLTGSVAE